MTVSPRFNIGRDTSLSEEIPSYILCRGFNAQRNRNSSVSPRTSPNRTINNSESPQLEVFPESTTSSLFCQYDETEVYNTSGESLGKFYTDKRSRLSCPSSIYGSLNSRSGGFHKERASAGISLTIDQVIAGLMTALPDSRTSTYEYSPSTNGEVLTPPSTGRTSFYSIISPTSSRFGSFLKSSPKQNTTIKSLRKYSRPQLLDFGVATNSSDSPDNQGYGAQTILLSPLFSSVANTDHFSTVEVTSPKPQNQFTSISTRLYPSSQQINNPLRLGLKKVPPPLPPRPAGHPLHSKTKSKPQNDYLYIDGIIGRTNFSFKNHPSLLLNAVTEIHIGKSQIIQL